MLWRRRRRRCFQCAHEDSALRFGVGGRRLDEDEDKDKDEDERFAPVVGRSSSSETPFLRLRGGRLCLCLCVCGHPYPYAPFGIGRRFTLSRPLCQLLSPIAVNVSVPLALPRSSRLLDHFLAGCCFFSFVLLLVAFCCCRSIVGCSVHAGPLARSSLLVAALWRRSFITVLYAYTSPHRSCAVLCCARQ